MLGQDDLAARKPPTGTPLDGRPSLGRKPSPFTVVI